MPSEIAYAYKTHSGRNRCLGEKTIDKKRQLTFGIEMEQKLRLRNLQVRKLIFKAAQKWQLHSSRSLNTPPFPGSTWSESGGCCLYRAMPRAPRAGRTGERRRSPGRCGTHLPGSLCSASVPVSCGSGHSWAPRPCCWHRCSPGRARCPTKTGNSNS